MLKAAEMDIKKDNHVLMVNKTTSFNKAKGVKRSFKKGSGKRVALLRRSSSLDLSWTLSASIARTRVTGNATVRST
jgi:hypothetical protein